MLRLRRRIDRVHFKPVHQNMFTGATSKVNTQVSLPGYLRRVVHIGRYGNVKYCIGTSATSHEGSPSNLNASHSTSDNLQYHRLTRKQLLKRSDAAALTVDADMSYRSQGWIRELNDVNVGLDRPGPNEARLKLVTHLRHGHS